MLVIVKLTNKIFSERRMSNSLTYFTGNKTREYASPTMNVFFAQRDPPYLRGLRGRVPEGAAEPPQDLAASALQERGGRRRRRRRRHLLPHLRQLGACSPGPGRAAPRLRAAPHRRAAPCRGRYRLRCAVDRDALERCPNYQHVKVGSKSFLAKRSKQRNCSSINKRVWAVLRQCLDIRLSEIILRSAPMLQLRLSILLFPEHK